MPGRSGHLGVNPPLALGVPLVDVLEDGGALLAVKVQGLSPREAGIEGVFDRQSEGGAGRGLLPPVEDEEGF